MTELKRLKLLERLKEQRDKFCDIADNLSQTDEAWLAITNFIEKTNQQIAKLEEETSCESS